LGGGKARGGGMMDRKSRKSRLRRGSNAKKIDKWGAYGTWVQREAVSAAKNHGGWKGGVQKKEEMEFRIKTIDRKRRRTVPEKRTNQTS